MKRPFIRRLLLLGGFLLLQAPTVLWSETDGTLDRAFLVGQGASDDVFTAVTLPGGGFVLGGYFTVFGGQERWRLARLHADGTLDAGFDPGDSSGSSPITQLAALPDGKILAAGSFNRFAGFQRPLVVRLEPDGKVDAKFNATPTFRGIEGRVSALSVLPDGKLLVGGRFDLSTERRGGTAALLVRLLADGRPDESFTCELLPTGREDALSALSLLPDGKLLVSNRAGVARLKADGSLDGTFDPPAKQVAAVTALAVQPNGKVLVATRQDPGWQLFRLESNGQPDATFHALEATGEEAGTVATLATQPDGKILVGGTFREVEGTRRHGLARLNTDGALDLGFDPGTGVEVIPFDEADGTPEAAVRVMMPLPGGRWLVAGRFDLYNGQTSHNLARIFNGAPASTATPPAK